MQTHEQLVAKLMRRLGVRKEVGRIEREEGELLDILFKSDTVDAASPQHA